VTFANAILRHDPLLIEPRLLSAFVARCGGFTDALKELIGESPQARIENGIGVLPITGIVGQGLMPIEKMLGATDTLDLSAKLQEFAADPKAGEMAAELKALLDETNEEDRIGVARVFDGTAGAHAEGGHLSHLERPNYEFLRYIAKRLGVADVDIADSNPHAAE